MGRGNFGEIARKGVPMGVPLQSMSNGGANGVPTEPLRVLQHPAANERPTAVCETGERGLCAAVVSQIREPPKRFTSELKWLCRPGLSTNDERVEETCRLLHRTTRGEEDFQRALCTPSKFGTPNGRAIPETKGVGWG